MAKAMTAKRQPQLHQQKFANSVVTIETAPLASRVSFRGEKTGIKSFETAIGFKLPTKAGETTKKAKKHALWIGPDEWFIFDEQNIDTSMVPRLPNKNFSAVDVSHRNMAFIVSGDGAENTLNAACPRDLSLKGFPVQTCSRTILDKAEVILYRTSKNTFRVECWRSFAPYVWAYLLDGAKEAHI